MGRENEVTSEKVEECKGDTVKGAKYRCVAWYNNNPNDPMLLLMDNSDSPSIVEKLS